MPFLVGVIGIVLLIFYFYEINNTAVEVECISMLHRYRRHHHRHRTVNILPNLASLKRPQRRIIDEGRVFSPSTLLTFLALRGSVLIDWRDG